VIGGCTNRGGGIETMNRLPSPVIAHRLDGVEKSCRGAPTRTSVAVRTMSTAIGEPDEVDRKTSSRPSSRHTGPLPPSFDTFHLAPAAAVASPGGVKERT